MREKLSAIAVAALVGGLIAAGCGDDDDSGEAADRTSEEWVAAANELCTRLDKETDAEAAEFFSGKDATEQRFVREIVAPGLDRWADELETLGAPPDQDDEVRRLAEVARQLATQFREADSQAEIRGAEGTETRLLLDEGKQLAGQLGIDAPCGDGSE